MSFEEEIILYDTDENSELNEYEVFSESSYDTLTGMGEIQIYEDDISRSEEFFTTLNTIIDYENTIDQEITDGQMFIGTYKLNRKNQQFLFILPVTRETFFNYPISMISKYFYWTTNVYVSHEPPVEIIKTYFVNDTFSPYCIIKTFWIRIIQRTWRRIFNERKCIIKGRSTLRSITTCQLTGYYPEEYRYMPRFSLFAKR
jgi:hypothetical protein